MTAKFIQQTLLNSYYLPDTGVDPGNTKNVTQISYATL